MVGRHILNTEKWDKYADSHDVQHSKMVHEVVLGSVHGSTKCILVTSVTARQLTPPVDGCAGHEVFLEASRLRAGSA
jgi:hypothetical protein